MTELICLDCHSEQKEPFEAGDTCICGGQYTEKFVTMLASEISEMSELILSMFEQGCLQVNGKYNHDCISAWEEAQEWLINHEMIKQEDCYYD